MRVRDEVDRLAQAKQNALHWQQELNSYGDDLDKEDIFEITHDLDSKHDAMGLPVKVFGGIATLHAFSEESDNFSRVWADNTQGVEGIYGGYHIVKPPEKLSHGIGSLVICHHVFSHNDAESSLSITGDYTLTRRGCFITAAGSDIKVEGFVKSHDMAMIEHDPKAELIDGIHYDSNYSTAEKIAKIARILTRKYPYLDTRAEELDRNRVSYANTFNLLDDLQVKSKLFYLVNYEGDILDAYYGDLAEFVPTHFELFHKVESAGATEFNFDTSGRSLHVAGLVNDQKVLAPVETVEFF